jgi:hypothetical protein
VFIFASVPLIAIVFFVAVNVIANSILIRAERQDKRDSDG